MWLPLASPAHVAGGVKMPSHSGSIASGTCVGKRNSQKAVMKKALASTAAKLARISQESPHAVGTEKLSSQPGKVAPVSSGGALVASLPSGGDMGSSYSTSQERAKGVNQIGLLYATFSDRHPYIVFRFRYLYGFMCA